MKKFAKVMGVVLAVALMSVLFTGCVLTAEKATEKLKKKEYTVISTVSESDGSILGDLGSLVSKGTAKAIATATGAKDVVIGSKTEDGKTEIVYITYFENKDDAKKMAESKDEFMKKAGITEDKDNEFVFKQSGNAVVLGTKKAVKIVA